MIHVYAPRKRLPRLTAVAARLALAAVLALLLGAGTWLTVRAQEAPEEPARFTPSARSGREVVRDLAEAHFAPEWVGWAMRTAGCESSFNPWARSAGWDRTYGWYEHVGAWQVSVPTWSRTAWELFGGDLHDPDVSAAMAAWIVATYGPSHWPVCGR